jgi:hypothetical protein
MSRATSILIRCLAGLILLMVSSGMVAADSASTGETPVAALLNNLLPSLDFQDITAQSFNPSGIEVAPFPRLTVYDFDGDGRLDLAIGDKNGRVTLLTSPDYLHWQARNDYFAGVGEGAFVAPAVGDLDGDGRVDLVVGTGGFSSQSGRILVYRNAGTPAAPQWQKIETSPMDVGDDAAPTVADFNFDGRPDIIAGNSAGWISFYRNDGQGKFTKLTAPAALRRSFGMYAAPAALQLTDRIVLAVGRDQGRVLLFELRQGTGSGVAVQLPAALPEKQFASPTWACLIQADRWDLLLADGDGGLDYYERRGRDFNGWKKNPDLFQNRLLAGPSCHPMFSMLSGPPAIVVGGIDGYLRLFESNPAVKPVPWVERKGYFTGIKLAGFSDGLLTSWEGRMLLVTGQGDGSLRAFFNNGTPQSPRWTESPRFFQGVRTAGHSTPCLSDLNGDGLGELIVGSVDGRLAVFTAGETKGNLPVWQRLAGPWDAVKVAGHSDPSVIRRGDMLLFLVGQEDGRIRAFLSACTEAGPGKLLEVPLPPGLKLHRYAAPTVQLQGGRLVLIAGDYDGNLREYLPGE